MQLDSIPLSTLHGGLNQRQRDRAMNKFASGRSMVLIATDVAARGIDVEGVNCVIHYDPPDDAKAYKHRSGRTARAGHSGVVISFIKGNEQRIYSRIQNQVGIRKRFTNPQPEDLKKNDFKITKEEPRKTSRRNGNESRTTDKPRRRNRGKSGKGRRGKGVGNGKKYQNSSSKPNKSSNNWNRRKKKRGQRSGSKKRKADARP